MNLALSLRPFETQDFRIDSSIFSDFLYEVREPWSDKSDEAQFLKKGLVESGRSKKSQKSLENDVFGVLTKI